MTSAEDPRVAAFARLLAIVDRLRAPGGCPWDRDQTLASVAPHLVEEAHEAAEALARDARSEAPGELGDLLMNVLLACRIAEDAGEFSLEDTAARISEKLVRRHPHVFGAGDAAPEARSVDQVLSTWEAIKKEERKGDADPSILAGVPAALPALQQAFRMGEKAARVGFRWQDVAGALAKLDEEIAELKEALTRAGDPRAAFRADPDAVEDELGDVLFAAVNVARHAGVDPERALKKTSARFAARFRWLEARLRDEGRAMHDVPLERLQELWREARRALDDAAVGLPRGAPEEWRVAALRAAAVRAAIVAAARDLPDDLARRRPSESEWSVVDVLEHLALAEGRLVAGLERELDAAEREGRLEPFPPEGLEAHPPRRPLDPPSGRIEAPEVVRPQGVTTRGDALAALGAGRARLFALLPRLAAAHPRRLVLQHPILGPLDVLQWFEFTALHERRHLEQVRRLRARFAKDGA